MCRAEKTYLTYLSDGISLAAVLRIVHHGGKLRSGRPVEGSCDDPEGDGGDLDYEVAIDSERQGAQRQSRKHFFFMDGMWEVGLREDSRITPRFSASAMERREVTFIKKVQLEKEHI